MNRFALLLIAALSLLLAAPTLPAVRHAVATYSPLPRLLSPITK